MAENETDNYIPNADFCRGETGGLPDQWHLFSAADYLRPHFAVTMERGRKVVSITGNGNENGVGWLYTCFPLQAGRTYRLSVRFEVSSDVDPYKHLLFSFYAGREWKAFNTGIFQFSKETDGSLSGSNVFKLPGTGERLAEVRIAYRLHAAGRVSVLGMALEPSAPAPERPVRVACVQGYTKHIAVWERIMDRASELGAQLLLLPETFTGDRPAECEQPIDGECGTLMSAKAREHRMYVAGTFLHRDAADGHLYNSGMLYDRSGDRIGRYDKGHLYSPELLNLGVTPGNRTPVFETEFGLIGMMICYDAWFTDVAELLALKGAEIILFPNAGYYRSLMPARANDNGVRIICSSMYGSAGIWDTSGADVERPDLDPSREAGGESTFRDVARERIGEFELLVATLELHVSPSAHNWGGPMLSAPGGRRNRREQKRLLHDEITAEIKKGARNTEV